MTIGARGVGSLGCGRQVSRSSHCPKLNNHPIVAEMPIESRKHTTITPRRLKEEEGMRDRVKYDYSFKIVLLGHSCVGKTALLLQCVDRRYSESFVATCGIDFRVKTYQFEGKRIKVIFYDTAGQDRFASIVDSYYRGSHGCLLVYDVGCRNSFDNLSVWHDKVKLMTSCDIFRQGISSPTGSADRPFDSSIPLLVVGNKCDLDEKFRQVSFEDGREFSDSIGARFTEASAKDGSGVQEAFELLVKHCLWTAQIELDDDSMHNVSGAGEGTIKLHADDASYASYASYAGSWYGSCCSGAATPTVDGTADGKGNDTMDLELKVLK